MERLRVIDLKAIAKLRGLRGYSKLRKADLIDLIRQIEIQNRELLDAPIPLDEIPKEETILKPTKAKKIEKVVERGKKEVENWGEWLLNSQPTTTFGVVVDEALESFKRKLNELHSKQSLENKKKREREVRKVEKKAEKRKREAEKRKREAEKRKREVEKRRKKRESKKRNKKTQGEVDRKEKVDVDQLVEVDIDQLVKDVEEDLSKRKDRVFDVEREIKRLKKKQRKAKGKRKRSLQMVIERLRHRFELVERMSALKHFAMHYKIEGLEGYGPEKFLSAAKPTILTFLRNNPNIKLQLALHCIMSKTDLETGKVVCTPAYFLSNTEINFPGGDVEDLYKTMMDKMLESLATYQQRGSNWVFDSVEELTLHTVKYEPLSGSFYIPLPKKLAD